MRKNHPSNLELLSLASACAFVALLVGCRLMDSMATAAGTPGPSGFTPAEQIVDGVAAGSLVKIIGGITALIVAGITIYKSDKAKAVAAKPWAIITKILALFKKPGA